LRCEQHAAPRASDCCCVSLTGCTIQRTSLLSAASAVLGLLLVQRDVGLMWQHLPTADGCFGAGMGHNGAQGSGRRVARSADVSSAEPPPAALAPPILHRCSAPDGCKCPQVCSISCINLLTAACCCTLAQAAKHSFCKLPLVKPCRQPDCRADTCTGAGGAGGDTGRAADGGAGGAWRCPRLLPAGAPPHRCTCRRRHRARAREVLRSPAV
jgi:hypothetical protein